MERGTRYTATRQVVRMCEPPKWVIRRIKGANTHIVARINGDRDPQEYLDRLMEERQ